MNPLLLLVGAAAWAAPLSLEAVRQAAVERSLEVEAAEAQAQAARGDAISTWSGHLPSVTAFASGTVGAGATSFGFERPVGTQVGLSLTGSWSLVAPGSWAAAGAARHSARGREAMAGWTRVEARRQATVAFAAVVAAEDAVDAWTRALDDAREGASAVDELVAAGLRPPSEAARAQADAATAEARLRRSEGSLATACASLLRLVRQAPAASCDVLPPSWDSAATTPRAAGEGEHPAVTAASEALRAATATRTGAWLERAPTLQATGTAATYAADGGDLAPGWSAGLSVELPLLTGGSSAGSIQAERARADAAEVALLAQVKDLDVARVSAEARFRAAHAGLAAQEAADRAARLAFEQVDERFQAGLEDLQPWLDARRDRDAAAVALAEARQELLAALAEVEAARGVW